MITCLAGGVGASKLLRGLVEVAGQEALTIIVNTGDDIELHGLRISPDLDIVTYTLAGVVDEARGWGIAGDTFTGLARLGQFGRETWFQLGDQDLALHIHRTDGLRRGLRLSEVADGVRRAFGLRCRVLPMSDQPVPTTVITDDGPMHFQEYLVRRGAKDEVRGVRFEGVDRAEPAPGVLGAIAAAEGIVVCPSNPVISIGPILAVPGIREALRDAPAPVVAVSPVVGGRSLKGPTDKFLRGLGDEVSASAVARLYRDFLDILILDRQDAAEAATIEAMDIRTHVTQTIMWRLPEKVALAREVLAALGVGARA
jgi:LPPG:FO 2-phospho-L-lactate transferase